MLTARNHLRVGPTHFMAAHSPNHFKVILPNSDSHVVSADNYRIYRELGLIRASKSGVGRLRKWLRAFPVPDGLRFEAVTPPDADEHALRCVHFLWLRIMSLQRAES